MQGSVEGTRVSSPAGQLGVSVVRILATNLLCSSLFAIITLSTRNRIACLLVHGTRQRFFERPTAGCPSPGWDQTTTTTTTTTTLLGDDDDLPARLINCCISGRSSLKLQWHEGTLSTRFILTVSSLSRKAKLYKCVHVKVLTLCRNDENIHTRKRSNYNALQLEATRRHASHTGL